LPPPDLAHKRGDSEEKAMIEYLGHCHCEALGVRYRTALPPSAWPVRACQCSFCRRHGALSTSDPQGELEFRADDPRTVQRYLFGKRIADFLLCRECGVYVGTTMVEAGRRLGVLNVRSLWPLPEGLPAAEPMNYDGESVKTRTERRVARWTPVTIASL
jgi:hypothetical protein